MFDKFFVGPSVTGAEDNGKQRPISRVTLWVDDENCRTAGDDSGLEIEADCPYADQAMVNALLAKMRGYQYQMFEADGAGINPAAELGDGVTVDGMYSALARVSDDGSGFPSISAPGKAELEDEYPAGGPMTQTFDRKITETRSSITKTAESITMMVNDTKNSLNSKIEQTAESLTTKITDANDNISSIQQYVNSITLSVSNGSTSSTIELKAGSTTISSKNITFDGFVTFSGLSGGTTTINGACIKTGTIDADRLNLIGAITWGNLSNSVQDDINGAYNYAESAYDYAYDALDVAEKIADGDYHGTFIDGTAIYSPTIYTDQFNVYNTDGYRMLRIEYWGDGYVDFSSPANGYCSFSFSRTEFYGDVYFNGNVEGISALSLLSDEPVQLMSESGTNAPNPKKVELKTENGALKVELPGATWYLDETGWHK